ncbi:unnamed protein product [Allacma fusca]|uniref:Uncharacterized protein n=1 Tax=Allacma fusca TaxID=39272 RepID=A0A8J2JP63_9HEXA|nr:unnamed protein product [Allacma fusca]
MGSMAPKVVKPQSRVKEKKVVFMKHDVVSRHSIDSITIEVLKIICLHMAHRRIQQLIHFEAIGKQFNIRHHYWKDIFP